MAYLVEIAPAAKRQIKKLTKAIQKLIVERLEELAVEPLSIGSPQNGGRRGFLPSSSWRLPDYLRNSGSSAFDCCSKGRTSRRCLPLRRYCLDKNSYANSTERAVVFDLGCRSMP